MPPPLGGVATLADFLSGSPGRATLCKPHKHDDVFPLCRTKLPSLTFNLVGRRLCLAKHAANTLLPSVHSLAYCCLPLRLNRGEPRLPIFLGCATATQRDTPRGRPSPCLLGQDGGACFVGRDVFVSSGGGTAGRDNNDDNFVSRLYPWWLVG